jgi:hypothetical protein
MLPIIALAHCQKPQGAAADQVRFIVGPLTFIIIRFLKSMECFKDLGAGRQLDPQRVPAAENWLFVIWDLVML